MQRHADYLDAAAELAATALDKTVALARDASKRQELPRTGLCHFCGSALRNAIAVYCADSDCNKLHERQSRARRQF